jgi:hypothetical protein
MPGPRSTACSIALACWAASLGASAATAAASEVWVRAVQPRGGAPLEIELGGDDARDREIVVKVKDPRGGSASLPFPSVPRGNATGPLRLRGDVLNRDFKGYTLEVLVRDSRTGEIVAAASTTIG